MGDGHPFVAEYGPLPEDYRLRFFPAEGKNGETIAKTTAGSESLQFIKALGKLHWKFIIIPFFVGLRLVSILLPVTISMF
jgi:hypothetical protein